jgi:hypothetical protein
MDKFGTAVSAEHVIDRDPARPEDYKGFKIARRSRRGPRCSRRSMLRRPRSTSARSIPLQTKIVEGQENPLALISTAKLYEVRSIARSPTTWGWLLVPRQSRAWEGLPEDVRTIVAKNINGAGMKAREDTEKLNANLQTELAAKGFTFNQPDLKPFREKLRQAGFYAEWKGKMATKPGRFWKRTLEADLILRWPTRPRPRLR